jgi:inorganic pyrophosphatase
MLHTETAPDAWWRYSLCGAIGSATSAGLVLITQYYTDYLYAPVKSIANASKTGSGTNVSTPTL